MRKIDKIIIHCSATPEGRDVTVEEIRKWHVEGNGWSDIGYHIVIERDGSVQMGRPLHIEGAHTRGQNKNSIGICYIGGVGKKQVKGKWVSKDTRTTEQKEALLDMLSYFKNLNPKAKIYGHRDFANKDCPSFDAKEEYAWISEMYNDLDLSDMDDY